MEDVFRLALSGTEKVVHSSSTALYGALDNDDFYMYMGGLTTAIRNLDGQSPELVVTDTRDPGRPEMTPIDKFIGLEFRSRYVNPTWIEGMMKEGYERTRGESRRARTEPGRARSRGHLVDVLIAGALFLAALLTWRRRHDAPTGGPSRHAEETRRPSHAASSGFS